MAMGLYSGPTSGLDPYGPVGGMGSRLWNYLRQQEAMQPPQQPTAQNAAQQYLAPAVGAGITAGFAQSPEEYGQGMSQVASQGQSFWNNLLQQYGGDAAQAIQAAQPYLQQIAGLQEAVGSYFGNKEMQQNLMAASGTADPFGPERGGYQERLRNTFTDPNWMNRDPSLSTLTDDSYIREYAGKDFGDLYSDDFIKQYGETDILGKLGDETYLQSISDRIMNDVAKEMSAKGYMNSGNFGMDLGRRLQQEIAPLSFQQQQAMANARANQAGTLANLYQNRFGQLTNLSADQARNAANLEQTRRQSLLQGAQNQQSFLGQLAGSQFNPANAASLQQAAANAGYNARVAPTAGVGYTAQQTPRYPSVTYNATTSGPIYG